MGHSVIFAIIPFPEIAALVAGFAILGFDGRFYLTAAGAAYLKGLDNEERNNTIRD